MNLQKRQARAKARAKTIRLIRDRNVPAKASKFGRGCASGLGINDWRSPGGVREWQSMRRTSTWAKTRAFVRSQVRDSAA